MVGQWHGASLSDISIRCRTRRAAQLVIAHAVPRVAMTGEITDLELELQALAVIRRSLYTAMQQLCLY